MDFRWVNLWVPGTRLFSLRVAHGVRPGGRARLPLTAFRRCLRADERKGGARDRRVLDFVVVHGTPGVSAEAWGWPTSPLDKG